MTSVAYEIAALIEHKKIYSRQSSNMFCRKKNWLEQCLSFIGDKIFSVQVSSLLCLPEDSLKHERTQADMTLSHHRCLKSLGRTNPLNTIFGWAPKTSNFEEQTKKVRARFQNNLKVLSSYDACYRLNFLKLREAWRATQFAHMHDSNLLGKSQLGTDLVHIIADSDITTTPIFS